MKKIITKRDIFIYILGLITCSVIVVLADTIAANLVTYDTSTSHSSYNTVQGAIDDLYSSLYDLETLTGTGMALISNATGGLSTTLIDGLYRYQGTEESASTNNVPNFICFGSNSCTEGTNKTNYLYRIIGIDADGQMKLIKWASIGSQTWNAAMATDGTGLNGSMFLTNTTYIPTGWDARIASTTWHYLSDNDDTVSTIGARELAATTTHPISGSDDPLKIGLMYLHDYADAYGSTPTYSNTSWIHISKNSVNSERGNEWTISRGNNSNRAWNVPSNGYVEYVTVANPLSVRPVFYLTSSQVIASGTGALDDPYILQ